jgi:Ca2+-binding RTX toxin-like protein
VGKKSAGARAVAAVVLLGALVPGAGTAVRAQGYENKCAGSHVTISGTSGDDRLRGTSGRDVIAAFGGNDVVHSFGGDDTICDGEGDDRVRAGAGRDAVETVQGADTVYGERGDDLLFVFETDPNDLSDAFYGGRGNDILADDLGDDLVDGGRGVDTYLGAGFGPTVIDLTRGYSAMGAGEMNTLVAIENAIGSGHSDQLIGDEGPNILAGGPEADTVRGEGGSDLLLSELDGDQLDGGSDPTRDGVMSAIRGPIAADLVAGTLARRGATAPQDRLVGIEDVVGTAEDDLLVGNGEVNRLFGGPGVDSLDGGAGDDVLFGDLPADPWINPHHWSIPYYPPTPGADTLEGGGGHDYLNGGRRRDRCTGGEVVERCEDSGADATQARRAASAGSWLHVLYPDAPPWMGMLRAELRRLEHAVL